MRFANRVPERRGFQVVPSACCLGCEGGLAAGCEFWRQANCKWELRAAGLAASELSAPVAAVAYNSRAWSVLANLDPIAEPPASLPWNELWVANGLLHLTTVLDGDAPVRMAERRVPFFGAAFVSACAAAVRAPNRPLSGWKQLAVEMKSIGVAELPLVRELRGMWWPTFWDTPAFAWCCGTQLLAWGPSPVSSRLLRRCVLTPGLPRSRRRCAMRSFRPTSRARRLRRARRELAGSSGAHGRSQWSRLRWPLAWRCEA